MRIKLSSKTAPAPIHLLDQITLSPSSQRVLDAFSARPNAEITVSNALHVWEGKKRAYIPSTDWSWKNESRDFNTAAD